ncbi:PHP domain-containing protein [Leekyejoonella antrihumi]|uniref:PHP domain-containing protein n=1 Tax=Leekyejoonella antrihumi TaxID=1660198 RepID=A0A563E8V7_9MICO|nr:PHP domain-containing protein [Leekyejoonella antrihumi]TWP38950.1 PHP domain-containing protein [Leekyejoonella antrihumi]
MGTEPVDALRRIAFLLERSRAGTYRVKAFRQAADTVTHTPRAELRQRADAGTLTELAGIGSSTARVILECLTGDLPEYLETLEEKSAGPLVDGGHSIRAALRGDCHCHSDWSDGGSPVPEMVATAVDLGHEYLVLTDHSPNLKVAHGLTAQRLGKQLDLVDTINEHFEGGFRLLKGIEADILEDGRIDQTEAMLARLDLRVASVHSKLRASRSTMTKRMLGAVENRWTNVLGHCTGRLVEGTRGTRPQSDFDSAAIFAACVEHDVAVEINSRPERQDPPDDLLLEAMAAGCLFSIDSDAHAPGQLDFVQYGCERAQRHGIPPERIINTWPAERLVEWARPASG